MGNLPFSCCLRKNKKSSGQALLVILLIMAVVLTIGLSTTSRSITDLRISQQTEDAARAFSAAEAGIEQSLSLQQAVSGEFTGTGVSYQTAVSDMGAGTEFVFPQEIQVDESQTVYLAEYGPGGVLTQHFTRDRLDLCWSGNAAIEVSYYYNYNSGGYKVSRYAVDPDGARREFNHFDPPDSGSCAGLSHKKTLVFPSGTPLFLRLRVLYESARVGIVAPGGIGGQLPSQGSRIESVGTAGKATRKVEVFRSHPSAIFDYVLYSGGDLLK